MKKHLRFLALLILCTLLCFSLIACDEETTDTTNAPNEQESTQSTQTQEPSDTDDGWEKPVTDVNALDYALGDDGSYYIVTGMGTFTSSHLYIPGEYEGKPVKEIAEGAFLECGRICFIFVPLSVETLRTNAFGTDIPVFLMHSYPTKGFEDGWIQNANNCYWYSEDIPLIEDYYNESYNYWYEPEFETYWGVFTDEYILTNNNKENMISVYTQYAAKYWDKTVTDDYFNFKNEKIFIGAEPIYFTSPESSLEEFGELKVGDYWSDVLKLDPFLGNYKWLFASYTKFPKYSTHFFMQAYYKIDYDDNYIITKIEKILPETN